MGVGNRSVHVFTNEFVDELAEISGRCTIKLANRTAAYMYSVEGDGPEQPEIDT